MGKYAMITNKNINEEERENLRESVKTYSTINTFEDDTWEMDKLRKNGGQHKEKTMIRFTTIEKNYKNLIKYYSVIRLENNVSIGTVEADRYGISMFLNYLKENYSELKLNEVTKAVIMDFEFHLKNERKSKGTKEKIWSALVNFFTLMKQWGETPNERLFVTGNPFSRNKKDRMKEEKYIPKEIVQKMDSIMRSDEVRLHYKLMYWICRLIPSRIGEVTSMKIDCISTYGEEYSIKLNMYKQNGGYIEPETRIIALKYQDMGKYLIDLIKEQQVIAQSLQEDLNEEQKGNLFTFETRGKTYLLNEKNARKFFSNFSRKNNFIDKKGKPYMVTSHKLRHNGITDRVYSGFTLLQIRDITAHKSSGMLTSSYIHYDKEKIKEKTEVINGEKRDDAKFNGKIINNDATMNKILKKPRSHKIGKMGVCSDITNCPSEMYECLGCKYFVPNENELGYFEEQIEMWKEKVRLFENHQFMRENAEYNLKLNMGIVKKIKEKKRG